MDPQAAELIARLRSNPNDRAAFGALCDHYRRLGDPASLANLLEGWAGRLEAPVEASAAFAEAGELVLQSLGDAARAQGLFDRAIERDPRNLGVLDRLLELTGDGDSARVLDLLRRRGAIQHQAGDSQGLADTENRIGQLYEHQYGRPDKAIAHYRKAFEADPALVPAIYAAREIYRQAGNHKAAATLLDLEARAETDTERRIQLLRELAHLKQTQLHDPAGAIAALEAALAIVPADLSVMHELATALLQRAEQRGEGAASRSERERAADIMVRMAESVPPEHGMAYCESALDAVPGNDAAIDLLEHLAHEGGRPDLLPLRWVGYLQAAPNGPGAPARRKHLGFAYLEAGQSDDALQCLEPLLESGDPDAARALIDLYRERGQSDQALRAMRVAVEGLPAGDRVPYLHEIIHALVAAGDTETAMERARQILAIDPDDSDAFSLLQEGLRGAEDWGGLRDLLVTGANAHGSTQEARVARWHEAASLSEKQLDDLDGAIEAWRGAAALDALDDHAPAQLVRLLEEARRWDELVAVLDHRALTATDPDVKVELLRHAARVHGTERGDGQRAALALRSILQLDPADAQARDALCDALLLSDDGVYEALPLLEARVAEAASAEERARLLELLASTLEERVGDEEAAFRASTQILDEDASNLEALDRMERIDVRAENHTRLLDTLSYRAEILDGADRAHVLARIGRIAQYELHDLERAAEEYQRALDAAPGEPAVLDALCEVFDASEKYKELVVLLRERAEAESDAVARAELYRRVARTLADRVHNADAASEAWERVLACGEDEEALRALSDRARTHHDELALEALLERLEKVSESNEDRREILLERSGLLVTQGREDEAIAALKRVLDTLDPYHAPAMMRLAELCEAQDDMLGLADALERQLALYEDPGMRLPVASRLADLYEKQLDGPERAAAALYAWIDADPMDTEPRERLAAQLEAQGRYGELTEALDGLAGLEADDGMRGALIRRAADVAHRHLGDVDGAWARLEPRIDDDPDADAQLRELAADAVRFQALVDVYLRRTQVQDVSLQRRRWRDAAKVYEESLGDSKSAFEAMLRAYATDLADQEMLAEVDRLAAKTEAWPRLAQVYERLIRTVETTEAKKQLLVRHADLLDATAHEPSEALDRVLRACSLDPDDDTLMRRAEDLAPRVGRGDELLYVYDTRKSKASTDSARVDAILRAAALCDGGMQDRERAFQYVAQAVALSTRSPELDEDIRSTVQALDTSRPELGEHDALRRLVTLYQSLGHDAEDDPRAGAELLCRAASVLDAELGERTAALGCLRSAASYSPRPAVLDPLEALVERSGDWTELVAHYARLIDEAIDPGDASELLRRRGRILAEVLGLPSEAADAYQQLLTLTRDDFAADRWLACLRKSERHQDMLVALGREMNRASDEERRLALSKETARVWERLLKNPYEAKDAWNKVLRIRADDPDALAALERLKKPGKEDAPAQDEGSDEVYVAGDIDFAEVAPPPKLPDEDEPAVVEHTAEHFLPDDERLEDAPKEEPEPVTRDDLEFDGDVETGEAELLESGEFSSADSGQVAQSESVELESVELLESAEELLESSELIVSPFDPLEDDAPPVPAPVIEAPSYAGTDTSERTAPEREPVERDPREAGFEQTNEYTHVETDVPLSDEFPDSVPPAFAPTLLSSSTEELSVGELDAVPEEWADIDEEEVEDLDDLDDVEEDVVDVVGALDDGAFDDADLHSGELELLEVGDELDFDGPVSVRPSMPPPPPPAATRPSAPPPRGSFPPGSIPPPPPARESAPPPVPPNFILPPED